MSKLIDETKMRMGEASLDTLLQEISVLPPGMWENENTEKLGDWYAVSNDDGIIAYFPSQEEAFHYRLDYINRILN